jgi:hypothetical protein
MILLRTPRCLSPVTFLPQPHDINEEGPSQHLSEVMTNYRCTKKVCDHIKRVRLRVTTTLGRERFSPKPFVAKNEEENRRPNFSRGEIILFVALLFFVLLAFRLYILAALPVAIIIVQSSSEFTQSTPPRSFGIIVWCTGVVQSYIQNNGTPWEKKTNTA